MSLSISGWGGNSARDSLYRLSMVHCILVLARYICRGLAESSDGQMSLSPAKGEMETVCELMAGMLSLKPPSTYLCNAKIMRGILKRYYNSAHKNCFYALLIFNSFHFPFLNYFYDKDTKIEDQCQNGILWWTKRSNSISNLNQFSRWPINLHNTDWTTTTYNNYDLFTPVSLPVCNVPYWCVTFNTVFKFTMTTMVFASGLIILTFTAH